MSEDILLDIKRITRQMFIDTADNNYILARSAFFDQLYGEFFWLSHQALEKYFKAILLMNRVSAKSGSHDLSNLHAKMINIDKRIKFPCLKKPADIDIDWHDESFVAHLEKLNQYGSPNNRYGMYGYSVVTEDLIKIDQSVWAVRRFCRPFLCNSKSSADGSVKEIDYVAVLSDNASEWEIGSSTPIEKLIRRDKENPRRKSFMYLNASFFPQEDHFFNGWRMAAANPPLSEYFKTVRSETSSPERRKKAAKVLLWVKENIFLGKDAKRVEDLLDKNADLLRD